METAPKITLEYLQRNDIKVDEYWSQRILEMIKLEKSNFIFTKLAKEVSIPLHEGTKTFTSRRYNHLPVGNHQLTEGITPTALRPEAQKVSGAVNQYGVVMEESDVAAEVHFDNIKTIYQPELARHAAEVIERNIITALEDGSDYFVGTGNTDVDDIEGTDIVTIKDFRIVGLTMKNYYRKGHKMYGGKFLNVVHSNVMQDVLDDSTLVSNLLTPGRENTPTKRGTVAQYEVYGMYFEESLVCPVVTNAATTPVNVYRSYVVGNDPFIRIKLGKGNVKFYDTGFTASKSDPLGQRSTFGYKLWTGAKVIDPIAITTIYSASAYDVIADFSTDSLGAAATQTDIA